MALTKCPACKQIIELKEKVHLQDFVTCPNCKNVLEVVRIIPLKLDWPEDPQISSSVHSYRKSL